MKKIAILGASYLQNPLIMKAKEMGIETHVFAWKCGDVGESTADFYYPISIIEKEQILEKCKEIGIEGICSISSDVAVNTIGYVANKMGLIANSIESCAKSTNKFLMRECFKNNGDPIPKYVLIDNNFDSKKIEDFNYPVIIKPVDRSGSRGIFKCRNLNNVLDNISKSIEISFDKKALIEEFVEGTEYSVECISQNGAHHLLNVTLKYTSGSPRFIETGHLEPAPITKELKDKIRLIVFHALDSLEIKNGASHSEIKIDDEGNIKIIEIGGRMGGDFIGSNLVKISTGFDFLKAVIKIALNEPIKCSEDFEYKNSFVKFIFDKNDLLEYEYVKRNYPDVILEEDVDYSLSNAEVKDSSTRNGYFIGTSDNLELIENILMNTDI